MSAPMGWFRQLRRRLRALARRSSVEREMDEEMRLHLELEAEDLARTRGLSPAQAWRQARLAFGGVERHKEEARDARRTRPLEDLARDAAYAVRGLRRSPGFATVAVLTLGLGIGGTAAIFSVVRGVLLRPLPYPEHEALVTVWSRFLPESGFDFPQFWVSPPEFLDYREENRSLAELAAYSTVGVTLTGAGAEPQRVQGAMVSGDFFRTLGIEAALGRVLRPEDDPPGGTARVVMGHGLWRSRYGGDPAVIGRTMVVDGEAFEVVGVMPAGFAYPSPQTVLWGPIGLDPANRSNRGNHFLELVGRLAPGVSLAQARAEMATLMARWKEEYPETHTGHFLIVNSLMDDMVGSVRGALWVLLGAVAFVLLIACANVANLILARNEARRQELAVRGALGAGRRRLIQQLLTDSLILAFGGGLLGVLLAWAGMRGILGLGAGSIPRADAVSLDAGVLLFALGVTLVTALLFGLAPALRSGARAPADALASGGRSGVGGRRAARLRAGLIVAEVALAVVLVAGAGLMLRSFGALTAQDPGFRPEGLLMAQLALPSRSYGDIAAVAAFHRELTTRLGILPGVVSVSGASDLPLYEAPPNVDFEIDGAPAPDPGEPARSGDLVFALPDYPETMGIRLLEGRFFTPSDDVAAPRVAVVNRTASRIFWRERSPIGARIRTAGGDGSRPWSTVVGVIDDVRWEGLDADPRPAYYLPVAQPAWRPSTLYYTLRVAGDPLALGPAVRRTVAGMDERLPLIRLSAMEELVGDSVARPRFVTVLLALFGAVALSLGAIGIYGVVSYGVTRRRRELGIRMALGAGRAATALLVLAQGMRLALVGVALGLVLAFATTRLMAGLLYGVSPTDPLTLAAVSGVLLGVAAAACWLPALRAVRVDPVASLRAE
ncbi:MAG TPA: ABC transporter permease [Longimicrobiales bacterium]|nr:ABC transporter permease [Longimicrobiales bacterium]